MIPWDNFEVVVRSLRSFFAIMLSIVSFKNRKILGNDPRLRTSLELA